MRFLYFTQSILVGGFNPSEKILVNWKDYPIYCGKKTCSKPPSSNYSYNPLRWDRFALAKRRTKKLQIPCGSLWISRWFSWPSDPPIGIRQGSVNVHFGGFWTSPSSTRRIHGAAIYGNIYHQYTPNVSIYTIHGSYGVCVWDILRLDSQWLGDV